MMAFNWLVVVGVFAIGVAIGVPADKANQKRAIRQQGRGRWFGETEIVTMGKWGVIFVSLVWAVLAGLTVAALGA